MKTTINFGKTPYPSKQKINDVTIEIELDEKDNPELRINACVWNKAHTNIVMGGQCLDNLQPYFKRNKLFDEIYGYWKEFHLNGMHPECTHQRSLGWDKQAKEPVEIYKFGLDIETIRKRSDIKNDVVYRLSKGETVTLTAQELELLNLPYSKRYVKQTDPPEHYKIKDIERTTRSWIDYNEFPEVGLLGKPCPCCGYKYGYGWRYLEIPEAIINRIKQIITENNDRTE